MQKKRRIWVHILIVLSLLFAAEIFLRVFEPAEAPPPNDIDQMKNAGLQVHFDRLFAPMITDGQNVMASTLRNASVPAEHPVGEARDPRQNQDQITAEFDRETRRFLVFPARKPAGIKRIFVLGSSPVWGAYSDDAAKNTLLVWHLDRLLQKYYGERVRFEVVNAAQVGFGGPEVIRSAEEVVNYDADLLIVYNGGVMPQVAGGIERDDMTGDPRLLPFKKALRSVRLFRIAGMIFGGPRDMGRGGGNMPEGEMIPRSGVQGPGPVQEVELGPDGIPMFSPGSGRLVQPAIFSKNTVNLVNNLISITRDDYRYTFEQTLAPAVKKGVPVIMCTVATNTAGIPPYWSLHWLDIGEEKLKLFNEAYQSGRQAFSRGDFNAALEPLGKAIALSPTFADAQYLYAETLARTGRRGEAKEHYHLAKEYDASNERALDRPNEILREVCLKRSATVVDSESVIARLDADGLIGNELFIDHQHPNGTALGALAEALIPAIAAALKLPL